MLIVPGPFISELLVKNLWKSYDCFFNEYNCKKYYNKKLDNAGSLELFSLYKQKYFIQLLKESE